MTNNIYWVGNLNVIGGVETAIYELAKMCKDYDFVIYYNSISSEQLKRLKKYVKCVKYQGEKLKCKKFFCNYDISIIDNVEAEEYIEIIHCVFKYNSLRPHTHEKITKYYAVGKEACESFKELTGKDCEVLHNILQIEKPKKVLRLISATRFASDKGKLVERTQKLIDELEKNNIPFLWLIFTNGEHIIKNKNVIYMEPRLDIRDFIADSDYLVQLSDTEAFCYAVLESLYLNTPVIVTPIPCFTDEMKVKNGINGYVLDFNMENIPINEIYNEIPSFKYEKFKNKWENVIIKKKGNYEEEKRMKAKVKCIMKNGYDDIELKRHINYGKEIPELLELERAEYLKEHNAVEILEVIKDEVPDIKNVDEALERIHESAQEEVKKTVNKKSSKKKEKVV